MMKKNTVPFGFICGLLAPMLGFWLYYVFTYHSIHCWNFLVRITSMGLSSAILSLCLLSNLACFFIFIGVKHDYSARGVLMVTIIYAIIGFLLKFLL